jgi:hypothetical protein
MTEIYTIYGLYEDNLIRYVGITNRDVNDRLFEHIFYSKNILIKSWVKSLEYKNKKPILKSLYQAFSREEALNIETKLIETNNGLLNIRKNKEINTYENIPLIWEIWKYCWHQKEHQIKKHFWKPPTVSSNVLQTGNIMDISSSHKFTHHLKRWGYEGKSFDFTWKEWCIEYFYPNNPQIKKWIIENYPYKQNTKEIFFNKVKGKQRFIHHNWMHILRKTKYKSQFKFDF